MINSRILGKGLPIVLLHGFGENLSLWNNLIETLSKNYKIISIDLPGFGQSSSIKAPFSIDDVAEIIHKYLSIELNEEPYIVMGHSLGGYVALALSENYPKDILGFGLINSTAFADTLEKKGNRIKTIKFIEKHGPSIFLRSFVPNLFYKGNILKREQEIDFVISMGENLKATVLANYMMAMKNRPDRRSLLGKFDHVLIVGGLEDAGISSEDYRKQFSLLKSKKHTHLIPSVGHMSMYEAPSLLNSTIKNFLKSIINDLI